MYEHKYIKYKSKYLNKLQFVPLRGGDFDWTDPDTLSNFNDADDEKFKYEEEILESMENDDFDEIETYMENKINKTQTYVGNTNITKSSSKIINIGHMTGKIAQKINCDKSEFTTELNRNHKILKIDDIDTFDDFTDKYGKVVDGIIEINWMKVSNDYRGIYVTSAIGNRSIDAIYSGKVLPSWVPEYKYIDDVIMFTDDKMESFSKQITSPFVGYVNDSYLFDEDKFTHINDPSRDKILIIDNIKDFDKFSNMYGYVKNKVIKIDWRNVNMYFAGIYIDDKVDFKKDRYDKAYYADKKVKSWWKRDDIQYGLVYMFKNGLLIDD